MYTLIEQRHVSGKSGSSRLLIRSLDVTHQRLTLYDSFRPALHYVLVPESMHPTTLYQLYDQTFSVPFIPSECLFVGAQRGH